MSLIPTFVFPRNTPNYRDLVVNSAVILESVSPSEDLNLVGCVRVNAGLLRDLRTEEARVKGSRVVVGVTYSKDGWDTRSEVNAMMVRKRAPEAIEGNNNSFLIAVNVNIWCEYVYHMWHWRL